MQYNCAFLEATVTTLLILPLEFTMTPEIIQQAEKIS